jgi:diguanylate cyclase (GGDEF)-like protein
MVSSAGAPVPAPAALLQQVLDSLPEHIALLGEDGTILLVNAAWERFAITNGAAPNESVGVNYLRACGSQVGRASGPRPRRIVPGTPEKLEADGIDAAAAAQGIGAVLIRETDNFTMEYPCHSPTEQRWFMLHAAPLAGSPGAVVSHFNITARKLAELAVLELAMRDPLTRLFNRRGFETQLTMELERTVRGGTPLAAILIDCDNFKHVNAMLGHTGGDMVLQTVADRLTSLLRPSDTLARIGGDEFLVLLPDTRSGEAGLIAERLRLATSTEPVAHSHGPVEISISAAVVAVEPEVSSLEEIVALAHVGLREAKEQGRDRISYGGSRNSPPGGITSPIAQAIGNDQFFSALMQPIVDTRTRSVVGYEMLSRGPQGPLYSPVDFLPKAIEEGVLTSIDLQCFRSCVAASAWLPAAMSRHINLYPSTLSDIPLHRLLALMPESLPAGTYCIELSEQQILGDPSYLLPHVLKLREAGIHIAIDDVGFGRTSLESLVILEPDVVKIDRRYVDGISKNIAKARALQRFVQVARTLEAMIVAEGVEAEADADMLVQMGVQYAQGYLYGRPVPAVE